MQLDLLSYQLTAEELPASPPPPPPIPPNPHARHWQQTKADLYLRLMARFMNGSLCSQAVRRHEIERLHQLRQQALAQL